MRAALVVPRPYPGCRACSVLMKTWVEVTEPASPSWDRGKADLIADTINIHRAEDEKRAPAL